MTRKGLMIMSVCYKKLWKLLIDKDMKKKDLIKLANISGYTLNRLMHNENVSTDTLVRICTVLNCNIGDIVDAVQRCETNS